MLVCGRKLGKTTLAAEEIIGCAIAKANRRVLYIAPTLGDARKLMWDRIIQKLAGAFVSSNDNRHEIIVRTQDKGQSVIFMGSWEVADSYRGDEFDFIIFDEIQDYRQFWEKWREAMRPTLTPRKGAALFMGTPKGFNHVYDLFNIEGKDQTFKSFKFTSYDNPFIDKEEIESARNQMAPDQFAQEYLAEFKKAEGLVYKEFDRSRHIYHDGGVAVPKFMYGAKQRNIEYEYIGGIDFGYQNPAAVLHIYYGKEHYWVDDEFYKRNRTDRQVAEYAKSCEFQSVYADPESKGGVEELVQLGCNVRDVVKGKGSVERGIQKVRELLIAGRLHINAKCLNLILEFESYAYDEPSEGKNYNEKPVKMDDHALDALRYVCTMKKNEAKRIYKQEEYRPATAWGV